jgi:CheY-like chemotaxis protein
MALSPHNGTAEQLAKILIVEDDKLLAYIMQLTLEGEGYAVVTAANGREGYAAYLPFRPDLVVTDVDMPEVDGLQMMRQIRTIDPKVKTIFMTGESEPNLGGLEQEKNQNQSSILEKPFSRIELLREVTVKLGEFSHYKPFAPL